MSSANHVTFAAWQYEHLLQRIEDLHEDNENVITSLDLIDAKLKTIIDAQITTEEQLSTLIDNQTTSLDQIHTDQESITQLISEIINLDSTQNDVINGKIDTVISNQEQSSNENASQLTTITTQINNLLVTAFQIGVLVLAFAYLVYTLLNEQTTFLQQSFEEAKTDFTTFSENQAATLQSIVDYNTEDGITQNEILDSSQAIYEAISEIDFKQIAVDAVTSTRFNARSASVSSSSFDALACAYDPLGVGPIVCEVTELLTSDFADFILTEVFQ